MVIKMSGFIYIWFDSKYKRYYLGAHWGKENDGYICSSSWMKRSYYKRPSDFRRRIIKSNIKSRDDMYALEMRYLNMIKESEIKPYNPKPRYYNLNIKNNNVWHRYDDHIKTIGQKISAAKRGKPDKRTTPMLEIGIKISTTKKESFYKREAELGYKFTLEHKQNLSKSLTGRQHTDEWKALSSERLKKQWADGIRKSHGPLSEEHRKKISVGNIGKKREDVSNYKTAHSKKYRITMMNGNITEVHGLKKYAADNNIPYVTLFKASQQGCRVLKYNINEISVLE
jgi:hypothetical protein